MLVAGYAGGYVGLGTRTDWPGAGMVVRSFPSRTIALGYWPLGWIEAKARRASVELLSGQSSIMILHQVATFPVEGNVTLNGQIDDDVIVCAHQKSAVDRDQPREAPITGLGKVDKRGKVRFTTYRLDDGLPAGEYVLTFIKVDLSAELPPDELGGRYAAPGKSKFTITVAKGSKRTKFGHIDLEGSAARHGGMNEARQRQIGL